VGFNRGGLRRLRRASECHDGGHIYHYWQHDVPRQPYERPPKKTAEITVRRQKIAIRLRYPKQSRQAIAQSVNRERGAVSVALRSFETRFANCA
jgi:hypothetical protein